MERTEVSRHPIRDGKTEETEERDLENEEDLGLPDFDGIIIIGLE